MVGVIHEEYRRTDGKLRIYPTLRCNYSCSYCVNKCMELGLLSQAYRERTGDEWAKAINRIGRDVIITGGEPTLFKGLFSLINRTKPNISITMYSNGSFNPENFNNKVQRKMSLMLTYHSGEYDVFAQTCKGLARNHRVKVTTLNQVSKEMLAERGVEVELVKNQQHRYGAHLGARRTVECYKEVFLIAPDGHRYQCVSKLVRQADPQENIIDDEFKPEFRSIVCGDYGICAPCDFLGTTRITETDKVIAPHQSRECDGISIITSAHNSARFVRAYLDSIRSQTSFGPTGKYEILFGVDHCPETRDEIIKERRDSDNIKVYWFDRNYGTYIVRNTLASKARYNYLLFFDSDDVMFPYFIEKHCEKMGDYDAVGQTKVYFNSGGESLYGGNGWENAKIDRGWGGQWSMWKSVYDEMGGFMPWICKADNEFIDRARNNGYKLYFYQEPLFFRRVHGQALTRKQDTGMGSPLRNMLDKERIIRKRDKEPAYVEPELGSCKEV